MSRLLTISSASGRFVVDLPADAQLRRHGFDCPAALDPARALALSRRRLADWAIMARAQLPAWLGEHRLGETLGTEEIGA